MQQRARSRQTGFRVDRARAVAFAAVERLLVVSIGGVLGSLARYGVSVLVGVWVVADFPWATLTVNVVGCLAIGFVASSRAVTEGPDWLRPFVIAGVLGGFTTFSAFALETGILLDSGRVALALTYVAASLVLGLLAVRAGAALHGRSTS